MNKRNFMQESYLVLTVMLLLAGIFFMTSSVSAFYNGFHNADLAFNSCLVSNDIGTDFRQARDFYDVGKTIPMVDVYIEGAKEMRGSLIGMIVGSFLIAYAIMLLVWEKKNE